MRTNERARVLEVGGDPEARHLDEQADDERADQGAERGAETTERDRGEHQQQHLRAHVPLDAGTEVGVQDAGEAGHRAGDAPRRSRTTKSTSMPDAAASDGLSEIARVALPMRE